MPKVSFFPVLPTSSESLRKRKKTRREEKTTKSNSVRLPQNSL